MKTFTEFNEGVLDFLSKDKREKRKKVKIFQILGSPKNKRSREWMLLHRNLPVLEVVLMKKKRNWEN